MVKDSKNGAKTLFLALVCTILAVSAKAEVTPYDVIANRNVFGLSPEVPPNPCHDLPISARKVKLVGITTILGLKQALLTVDTSLEAGKSAVRSVTLAEGEKFSGWEVLQINQAARTVRVGKNDFEAVIHFGAAEPKK